MSGVAEPINFMVGSGGIKVSGVAEPINFMVGSGGIKVSGVAEPMNFMVGSRRFSACEVEPLFGRLRV